MKKIFCSLGLMAMICMFSVVSLQAAINVPGDYPTIQAAINAAGVGDTIIVEAGTYPEMLEIKSPLTINGADGAVLDGSTLGLQKVGVKIKSGDVTFNNVDVVHFSGNGIIVGYEASIPGSLKNVHITNCKISGIQPGYSHGFGIYVGYQSEDFKRPPSIPKLTAHLDYSGLLIENNEITDSRSSSLVLQSITGTPGTLMVRNNYIHDNDNDGIWIDSARNINIEGNTVANNPDGVYISSYGDQFIAADYPAWHYDQTPHLNGLYGPKDISITGNKILNNTTYGGVYLQDGYPATISINGNSITGNTPEGVANYLSEQVNATCNWWGAKNGPGLVGTGAGDKVSNYVTFSKWLTSQGGACNGDTTTPPAVTVPGNITAEATGPGGANVSFTASALDIVDGPLTPTCTPSSGSLFPLGVTQVTCSATDSNNNTGTNSFTVMVIRPVATNKDWCKLDGWKLYIRADGSSFKNQGDCVSYVNTGK